MDTSFQVADLDGAHGAPVQTAAVAINPKFNFVPSVKSDLSLLKISPELESAVLGLRRKLTQKAGRRDASKFANLESRTWFTGQQRARYLELSEGTENRYQKLGIGPRAIKIGNGSRSRRDWCDAWILEGGVTRPDRAAVLRAANKAAAARPMEPTRTLPDYAEA